MNTLIKTNCVAMKRNENRGTTGNMEELDDKAEE